MLKANKLVGLAI